MSEDEASNIIHHGWNIKLVLKTFGIKYFAFVFCGEIKVFF